MAASPLSQLSTTLRTLELVRPLDEGEHAPARRAPAPTVGVSASGRQAPAPAVSVILPTYNRAPLLARAILSVLRQTYQDFELIVVDDGSTDATPDVLAAFDDERLVYLRQASNQGPAAARNIGLQHSRGQYIAFQDSDDEWRPEKLERQVPALSAAPCAVGVVYSRFQWVQGARTGLIPSPGLLRQTRREGDLRQVLARGNFITLQAAIVRRACFEKVGGFDERLWRLEDWELWLRIAAHYQFRYVDLPLVTVCFTPGSLSTSQEALLKDFELLLEKHGASSQVGEALRAQYLFARGDAACHSGDFSAGQADLFQALNRRPWNGAYLASALATLLGPRGYAKVMRRLGGGYVRN